MQNVGLEGVVRLVDVCIKGCAKAVCQRGANLCPQSHPQGKSLVGHYWPHFSLWRSDGVSIRLWLNFPQTQTDFGCSGHGVKVVRALAHGEQICRPYIGKPGFVMGGDMWWKAAAICEYSSSFLVKGVRRYWWQNHTVMDYLEEGGREYIFSVGFEEAWAGVGPKKRYGNTPKL